MAYDEFAVLTDRMFRIVMDPSKRITENRDGFLEGDAMLLEVLRGFATIPRKLHGRSASYSANCAKPTRMGSTTTIRRNYPGGS